MGRCCSRPTPRRSTPIATTAPSFTVRLDSEGVMSLRLVAQTQRKGVGDWPAHCPIGQILMHAPTCCGRGSVLTEAWCSPSSFSEHNYAWCRIRTSEKAPYTHSGE